MTQCSMAAMFSTIQPWLITSFALVAACIIFIFLRMLGALRNWLLQAPDYAAVRQLELQLRQVQGLAAALSPNRFGRQRTSHIRWLNLANHDCSRARHLQQAGKIREANTAAAEGLKHLATARKLIQSAY